MTLAYTEASPAAAPNRVLSGIVLEGRYSLGTPLGAGGMGTVYAGKQLRLDRDVAIKVLDPAIAQNAEAAARFLREAQLLSRIRHPNVIQVLDSGESDGLMYCVMERLVGSDLEQLQARMPHGRMPWPGACDLLAQLAEGLGAVHARGIVHRDVKPSNCFVSFEDGNAPVVKLLDFGVARATRNDAGPKLTHAGLLIGTPSHIAPELLTAPGPATPTSDLYALGVVAYRLLSGRLPFEGDTLFAQMNAACNDEPQSLDDPDLDIPVELQRLVLGLLEKDPAVRLQDAKAVAERFRVVAGHGAAPGLPPLAPPLPVAHDDDTLVASRDALDSDDAHTTVPVPVSEYDSLEAFDIEELAPARWRADRRVRRVRRIRKLGMWLALVLALALLVALASW